MDGSGISSYLEDKQGSSMARKRQRVDGSPEVDALRLRVEQLEEANRKLSKQLRRSEDRIWAYELEQKSHASEMKRVSVEHETKLEEAETRWVAIETSAQKLLATVQRHERKIPGLERRNSELEAEKDRLARDFDEREQFIELETDSLKLQLTSSQSSCKRLEDENAILKCRVGELQTQLESSYRKRDSFEVGHFYSPADERCLSDNQIESVRNRLRQTLQSLSETKSAETRLERENSVLLEGNRLCRERISNLGADIARCLRDNKSLRGVITGLKTKIVALEQEERMKGSRTEDVDSSVERARKRAAELENVADTVSGNGRQSSSKDVYTKERTADARIKQSRSGSLQLVDTSIEKSWTRLCEVLDFYKTNIGDTTVSSPQDVLEWFKEQHEGLRFIDTLDVDEKVKRNLRVNRLGLYTVLEHTLIDLVADNEAGEPSVELGTTTIKAIIATALEAQRKDEMRPVKKEPLEPTIGEEVLNRGGAVQVLHVDADSLTG